jgi:hypothetical protein
MTSAPVRDPLAAWLRQARSYLRHADPVLARLIDDRPDFDPRAWLAQLRCYLDQSVFELQGAPPAPSHP